MIKDLPGAAHPSGSAAPQRDLSRILESSEQREIVRQGGQGQEQKRYEKTSNSFHGEKYNPAAEWNRLSRTKYLGHQPSVILQLRQPKSKSLAALVIYVAIIAMFFSVPVSCFAQVDDAKAAIDRGDYVIAVEILTRVLAQQPSADAYLYLGTAYRHMREWDKAENILKDGGKQFPRDPRFTNELAEVYLGSNDVEKARDVLRSALEEKGGNDEAANLLAAI